ncbi:hypothetical protein TeGR_g9668 [Tetraparma gracilis]|uniref:PX domain-containing protein n=1 Tax=Tetraparma gracilis TaxID=2962635 RepID=A0ABQ6MBE5_9STRA|nr:hypothetical protein TeGR_g9668 [Tetraparma gracilis]
MSEIDHATWLLNQLSLTPEPIWVDSPLEEGSGFSKYVTYSVCVPSHSVRHRYSDFEKLQATLRARYQTYGLLVPSLPKKNVLLKGSGFHFQRMRGLQLFLERISSNPYLRDDPAWQSFLEPNAVVVIEREAMPPAPLRWMRAVDSTTTPPNCGELVAHFKEESALCEQQITALVARSWAVSGAVQKLSVSIGDLATAAVSFSEVETNEIDALNTLSTAELSKDGGANSVPNVLSRQAQLLSSALSCLSPCPDAINLLFIEALEYENSQMVDFGNMAKHVDKISADSDKNERSLASLQGKSTAKMAPQKVEQHEAAIAHTVKLVEESKKYLDKYIRALCKVTMPQVTVERKERIKQLSLHMAAIVKTISAHNLMAADAFFAAMKEGDGSDAIDSASMVLESLSLPPLPEGAKKAAVSNVVPRQKQSTSVSSRSSANFGEKPPAPPSDTHEV